MYTHVPAYVCPVIVDNVYICTHRATVGGFHSLRTSSMYNNTAREIISLHLRRTLSVHITSAEYARSSRSENTEGFSLPISTRFSSFPFHIAPPPLLGIYTIHNRTNTSSFLVRLGPRRFCHFFSSPFLPFLPTELLDSIRIDAKFPQIPGRSKLDPSRGSVR